MIKKILMKIHSILTLFVPGFYHAYKLPTGGSVYIDITESPMMFARIMGWFEPQKHRALDFFLSQDDAYVDIGANKGDFAIHAALVVEEKGKVVAFEPEPENCKWIRKSIKKSNLHNIVVEEAAIGEDDGSLNLFIGEKSGWHSLVTSEQNIKKESISVKVHSLDRYLEMNNIPNLKAIKIDVEGFEKEVLFGAHKTLSQNEGLVLFIDIHPSHGVKPDEIYEILHKYDFSLYKESYPFNLPIDLTEKPLEIVAIKNKKSGGPWKNKCKKDKST